MKKICTVVSICIIASLIIMACKKGNSNNPLPLTTGAPAAPFGGQLQVNNVYNDNTLYSNNPNDSSGTAASLLTGAVNIGTVSVNNDTLNFLFNSTYTIPTNLKKPLQGKATWHVTGGSGFGAFTFTTVKNIPSFTNLNLSLSSISKAGNLVITHPIIMADNINYTIIDFNGNRATKVVVNSSAGITFTPAMMASLTTTNNATLQVTGIVAETSIQGGKAITFLSSSNYSKGGIAIN